MTALRSCLLAAVAVAFLGGCDGLADPYRDAAPPAFDGPEQPRPKVAPGAVPVALRYSRLARSRAAATIVDHYERQLAITTGPLRDALERSGRPRASEVAELRRWRASQSVVVRSAAVRRAWDGGALVDVATAERIVEAGQITARETVVAVEVLEVRPSVWRVNSFTAKP